MYRSTKGASKARRDQINAEIRNLKDLLPISDADKARLSYLHIMSLACMYTRKSVFFSQESETAASLEESPMFMSFHELSELVHELPGFLLLLSGEGKLLYLSDGVTEHLGHSMVDLVAQGDSVYDIIDSTDHVTMRTNLAAPASPDTDRLFRCRFNTSKSVRRQSAGNKLVLIRARCLAPPCSPAAPPSSYWTSNPVWVCFCTPLEPLPAWPVPAGGGGGDPASGSAPADANFLLSCFQSQHGRDMRLQNAHDSVSTYLGYDVTALRSRSWYSLVHPQDLSHASAQHCSLLREGGEGRAEMVVRVETEAGSWVWLYMVLQLEAAGDSPVRSNNFLISEEEAWSVRRQLSSEQTQLSLTLSSASVASAPDSAGLRSPDTLSSPDQVFTPSSSGLSAQSFDFSMAVCGAGAAGSADEPGVGLTAAAVVEPMPLEGDPRSSLSSLEEESFFQTAAPPPPALSPSAASSPTPVTVATVADLDFLTQNILLPPSFQLEPPLPSLLPLPLPLPLSPASSSSQQQQQSREFECTPPYTPQLGRPGFPFGEPLFSFDPAAAGAATTTPPPSAAATATTAGTVAPAADPPTTASSPAPPTTTAALLPLALPPLLLLLPPPTSTSSSSPSPPITTELLFSGGGGGGSTGAGLYEKLPPTPDSPGDGDCTVMTLPEVRGPLYVDVPLAPLRYPPEGLLTPEASPGKQPYLSFFSLEREREKERAEISLLAQHISTMAEGFYLDPLLSKLSPPSMSPSSSPPSPSPSPDAAEWAEFYPVKAWRGLDFPLFSPEDDDSLFEESVLDTLLLQDFSSSSSSSSSLSSPPLSPSALGSPSASSSSSSTPTPTPTRWHPLPSHFEGVGLFCSVQSVCSNTAGAAAEEEAMEVDVVAASSPLSSCSSISECPPLILTATPSSSPAPGTPNAGPHPSPPPPPPAAAVSCAQSLLEELVILEPMFGAGASIAPGLGQQPELYQLQCLSPQQCFRHDGSGSVPPF